MSRSPDGRLQETSEIPTMKKILQSIVNIIPFRCRSFIKHIPGLKQLQQKLMVSHLDGACFEHRIKGGPADGLIYPVKLPDDKAIWLGNYEQTFSAALATAVESQAICYDIGGYRGFFSGVMACQGAADVFVFEPLPENQNQIRKLIDLNPDRTISLFPFALADEPGETTFTVMPEASMGKLDQSNFDSGDAATGNINVQVETLDGLLASGKIKPARLIKIDVEGAEYLVLKGARSLIQRHHPTFFIEAHSHSLARACSDFLKSHGYRITVLQTGLPPDYRTEPAVCHLVAVLD